MSGPIFVGIGGHVVALRPEDGGEVWRTKLKGGASTGSFVGVALAGGRIYAGTAGEVWCLDPATGTVLWHNPMKRLGMGFVTFAGTGPGGAAQAAEGAAQTAATAGMMAAVIAATSSG